MAHRHRDPKVRLARGFSIAELMIAAALGLALLIVGADAMVSHLKSSAEAESLQRQRDDWSRATSFMESEIAMSERVFTDPTKINIPSICNLEPSEVRLALDLKRNLAPIIYGVKTTSSLPASELNGWVGERVLVRCGPDILITDNDGEDYAKGAAVSSVLIDGLDANAPGQGFYVQPSSSAKSASFTLAIKGLARSRYSFGSGSHSRVNPVAGFPEEESTCDRICSINSKTGQMECKDIGGFYIIKGAYLSTDLISIPYAAVSNQDNVTVCSLGGSGTNGDTITGSPLNDVLDAGNVCPATANCQGATITGGSGRNYLFGTPASDVLIGGPNDDTLIGRGGNDQMNGGEGNNSYLPWPDLASARALGNVTITGGNGLDVVYLRGNRSDFNGSNSCNSLSCTISRGNASVFMQNINVLIFKDGRADLP
jgi:hypothetical protein